MEHSNFAVNTRKIEINNEIVLLRQFVRQARICVINKLIREIKKLRTSHGNDKQLEKNKNKANRLLREVFALKHIKDDDISKFGIVSFKDLQDTLRNSHTDGRTRAMAKVVRYKCLSSKIIEFQEKFPDYNEYICWRNKKHLPRRRENCLLDTPEIHSKQQENDVNGMIGKTQEESMQDVESVTCVADISCRRKTKITEKLPEEKEVNRELKKNGGYSVKISKLHNAKIELKNDRASKTITKVISSEATVKRFTEIMQAMDQQNDRHKETKEKQSSNETTKTSKKMDDFFLNANVLNETPLRLNISSFSEERSVNGTCNVNHDTFKLYEARSEENRSSNGKGNKEKGNGRGHNICDKYMCRDQNGMRETGNMRRKESKKGIEVEEKRNVNNDIYVKNENLHPSWAAKRRQQYVIKQGFQGKKIKFDED